MIVEINLTENNAQIAKMKKEALEKIGNAMTMPNLAFLAKLADKKGINEKLESKKTIIQLAL